MSYLIVIIKPLERAPRERKREREWGKEKEKKRGGGSCDDRIKQETKCALFFVVYIYEKREKERERVKRREDKR